MASRNANSARNVTFIVIKQVILILLNFIAKTIFIRVLSKEYLGLNGVFNNISLLFSFAEMGLGTAMIYSFYEPLARGDKEKCVVLYKFFHKLYLLMSVIMTVAGILMVPLLTYIIDTTIPMRQVVFYYILYVINTAVNNMFMCKSNIFVADQKQYIVSVIQLIFEGACFVFQAVLLLIYKSYFIYIVCSIIRYVLFGILYTYCIRRKYAYLMNEAALNELEKTEKKAILNNTKSLFIYKFAKILIDSSDNIIISMLVGTVVVGMYSNYEFVISGLWAFVYAFFSAFSASVGNLLVENRQEQQYEVYKAIELIDTWISGFCAICLFVLFQDFITLWAGSNYLIGMSTVFVIVINFYLKSIRESTSIFREAAGLFKKYKNVTLITATINIVMSFIMGHFYGMFGVFLATSVSVLFTYFWYEPYLVHKECFRKPLVPYFVNLFKNIAITLLIGVVTYLICSFIKNVSVGTFVLKGIVCIIVPNAMFFVTFRRTDEFKFISYLCRRQHK